MDHFLDSCFVALSQSGFHDVRRRVITVVPGETLFNLGAAPVAMHIAEAAYVHQDVKLKLLAGMETAQQLIMRAAVAHTQISDLAALLRRERLYALCNLPVGMMARRIQQRCGDRK